MMCEAETGFNTHVCTDELDELNACAKAIDKASTSPMKGELC